MLTVLGLTTQNREPILRQYWTQANNSLNCGRTGAPCSYVMPADQPRLLLCNSLQQLRRRFVACVLRHEFAAHGQVGNEAAQGAIASGASAIIS
ncbi:hypothetical protein BH23GEM3_BH23GEM3_03910 [soil metagenome]